MRIALSQLGPACLCSAGTTLTICAALMFCTIQIFLKFGVPLLFRGLASVAQREGLLASANAQFEGNCVEMNYSAILLCWRSW